MNKQKRAIIQSRTNFVKKLASQMRDPNPFWYENEQFKSFVNFYTTQVQMPSVAKNKIKNLKNSKLMKLFFKLMSVNDGHQLAGFFFHEKIIMCSFSAGVDPSTVFEKHKQMLSCKPFNSL